MSGIFPALTFPQTLTIRRSAVALCLIATITLPQLGAAADRSDKQRFAAAMAMRDSDPQQAVRVLEALAQAGYARASDRLGYFSLKGFGMAQDTDAAIAHYQRAVADGRSASLISLGKTYMTTGQHQQAIDAFQQATKAGHVKAEAVLAWAHATGRLGGLSQQDTGFDQLTALATTGLRQAEMYLLDAAARLNRRPHNLDQVLSALHTRHDAGDAKAAEALLRYYRAQRHPRGTVAIRKTLLNTDGLRDKIRVEEGLHLARDATPARFWVLSEDLVATAPPDVYARALSVTARINKNAYVRILQRDLRQMGYPVGRASPYMNAPLIRSINRFCRDHNIAETCALGPLKSTTIKAVAAALAAQKATL